MSNLTHCECRPINKISLDFINTINSLINYNYNVKFITIADHTFYNNINNNASLVHNTIDDTIDRCLINYSEI